MANITCNYSRHAVRTMHTPLRTIVDAQWGNVNPLMGHVVDHVAVTT
jgi:hypothetical protein